jgi:hypothetical protein
MQGSAPAVLEQQWLLARAGEWVTENRHTALAQPVSLSMPGSSATFVGRGRPWVALVRSSTGTRSPACCQCGHTASVDRAPAAVQPGRLAGPGARECFSATARQGAKVSIRSNLPISAATSNACARGCTPKRGGWPVAQRGAAGVVGVSCTLWARSRRWARRRGRCVCRRSSPRPTGRAPSATERRNVGRAGDQE